MPTTILLRLSPLPDLPGLDFIVQPFYRSVYIKG